MTEETHRQLRLIMVEEQLRGRGIRDQRVLHAMRTVPRHLFVTGHYRSRAYDNSPLPIGYGQTISQPYIVALMLEALALTATAWVLEIGTGSGYQAALLGELARQVYTVEIIPDLAQIARTTIALLDYHNVEVVTGNGSIGWQRAAPYDAIIGAAAAPRVPHALVDQLAEGGRLVLPVGTPIYQELVRMRKQAGTIITENLGQCIFVPLVGEQGWQEVIDTRYSP
jgi:protein-L-isoaspartate(D-aspartate) O-methyltransferase